MSQRKTNLMNFRWVAGFGSLLVLLVGCGSSDDKNIESKLAKVSAHRSAHPHYPVMAFDDFGKVNGVMGIAVDVFSSYSHATTKPDPLEQVTTTERSSKRLASVFASAIHSLIDLESSTPAPQAPYPTSREWKEAPHPPSGTYAIVVQIGMKSRTFQVRCSPEKGEDAVAAIAKVQPQLLFDANQVLADRVQVETAETQALNPPPGFNLVTQELVAAQKGANAVDPHLIGDPLCIVPLQKSLAVAGLDHSIKKLLTTTGNLKPSPKVAHLLINGPGFSETYAIAVRPGADQDQAISVAEKEVAARLDDLNRKSL